MQALRLQNKTRMPKTSTERGVGNWSMDTIPKAQQPHKGRQALGLFHQRTPAPGTKQALCKHLLNDGGRTEESNEQMGSRSPGPHQRAGSLQPWTVPFSYFQIPEVISVYLCVLFFGGGGAAPVAFGGLEEEPHKKRQLFLCWSGLSTALLLATDSEFGIMSLTTV